MFLATPVKTVVFVYKEGGWAYSAGTFILLAADFAIVHPGFGIFGTFGIISLILGIFTFEAEPFFSPKIFEAMTMVVFGAVIAICILFIIIGRGVIKSLREKPKAGSEALIGEIALVIKTLDPAGQVEVKGEIWPARSLDGKTILKGTKVEIVKVEGNTLYVKESK